jgi:phenol hydroxylase P3 protein
MSRRRQGIDLSLPRAQLTDASPLDYAAYRGFTLSGRNFRGAGARIACQTQAIDKPRHAQMRAHPSSQYPHSSMFHDVRHHIQL